MTNQLKFYWLLSLIVVAGASFASGYSVMRSRFERHLNAATYESTPMEISVWLKACSNSEEAIRSADPMFKQLVTANLSGVCTRASLYSGMLAKNGKQTESEELKAAVDKTIELKQRLGRTLVAN